MATLFVVDQRQQRERTGRKENLVRDMAVRAAVGDRTIARC